MSEETADQYVIRKITEADFPFIYSSWLHSYKDSSDFAKRINREIFYQFHHKVVERILLRPTTIGMVACAETDQDLIYGYAIFESIADQDIFHYIYVKKAFGGKFGISENLLKAAPFSIDKKVYASHMTYKGRKLIDKFGLIYCPYLL